MYIPNVDDRMAKVRDALDRHPELCGDARTDVWNRCYEAVSEALHAEPPKKDAEIAGLREALKEAADMLESLEMCLSCKHKPTGCKGTDFTDAEFDAVRSARPQGEGGGA